MTTSPHPAVRKGERMNCKNCEEHVVENRVRRSPEPRVYHPWKHETTHLIGCFNGAEPTGAKAWPREEK